MAARGDPLAAVFFANEMGLATQGGVTRRTCVANRDDELDRFKTAIDADWNRG
jgi:hypothetical protein